MSNATEFGRTPTINQNVGRDHYPKAFSGFLAGGGIKGGQTYGKTDEGGYNVIEDKVTIPDFNATIAYALGLPLGEVVYSPTRRPFMWPDKAPSDALICVDDLLFDTLRANEEESYDRNTGRS